MTEWYQVKNFQKFNKMDWKKIKENNMYRQGRSEEQVRGTYIGAFIAMIGIVVTLIIAALTS